MKLQNCLFCDMRGFDRENTVDDREKYFGGVSVKKYKFFDILCKFCFIMQWTDGMVS